LADNFARGTNSQQGLLLLLLLPPLLIGIRALCCTPLLGEGGHYASASDSFNEVMKLYVPSL